MIYVIMGPTASGKSDAAKSLAEFFDAYIINADAFQIYKDMNIGTNKISENDEEYSRYKLLSYVSPDKNYSVKQYQDDFRKIFFDLYNQNKNIVIVGGTGLYIKASLYDYEFSEENNEEIDEDLINLSNHELHEILQDLDFLESQKIHENNRKRVLRAIMMIRRNKISKSESIARQEHKLIVPEEDIKFLYIKPDRVLLYERINSRVDLMVANGLLEEVKGLLEKYELSLTAKAGIGYKEIISYLNNEISYEEAIELIKKRTRNYAKRQDTFFLHQFKNVHIYSSKEELVQDIIKK